MEIPNLPTDNLYKFMATSGIVIIIVSFIISYYGTKDSITDLNNIHTEYCLLDFEIENLKDSDSVISNEINKLENVFKRSVYGNDSVIEKRDINEIKKYYSDPKNRDLFIFLQKYWNILVPETEMLKELERKLAQRDEIKLSIKRKGLLLKERYRIWENADNRIRKLNWLCLIFCALGAFIASNGFILWYKKVQKYLDAKIKNTNNET